MPRLEQLVQSERVRPHDHPIIKALYANREQLVNMELDPNVIPDYDFLFQALLNGSPYDLTAPSELEYIWKCVTDALSEIDQRQINRTPPIACAIASAYLLRNRGSFWQGLPQAIHNNIVTLKMASLSEAQLQELSEINAELNKIYTCIKQIETSVNYKWDERYSDKGEFEKSERNQSHHLLLHAFKGGLWTLQNTLHTRLNPALWSDPKPKEM